MLTHQLPRRIRYIPASGLFTAAFGVPSIGSFDFNGQYIVLVQTLLPNTVYLIDSFSLSGNVAGEDFLNSILSVPSLSLMKTLEKEAIFDRPIQIHNFFTDRQIARFFKTGQNKTGLAATLTGNLDMIPAFVGVASISLSINFSLYAVDESDFEKKFTKNS
jgi:hypothetical protein